MLDTKDEPLENNCLDCARYRKKISELKDAFIRADYQSVCQSTQLKDEISELNEKCSHAYTLLDNARSAITRSKTGTIQKCKNKRRMLEADEQSDRGCL